MTMPLPGSADIACLALQQLRTATLIMPEILRSGRRQRHLSSLAEDH